MKLLQIILMASVATICVQAQAQTLDEAFHLANQNEKARLLNQLAVQELDPSGPAELVELFRIAVADELPRIRQAALMALASRASGPRFSKSPRVAERWLNEHAALRPLRVEVNAALRDRDGAVRHAALIALGSLDYSGPETQIDLSPETVAAFLGVSASDPDFRVRTEVTKSLALIHTDNSVVRERLVAALGDSVAGVRRYAWVGMARLKAPEGLARLGEAITDADAGVRAAAAKAAGAYGKLPAELEQRLRDALVNEVHPVVKTELQAAMSKMAPR